MVERIYEPCDQEQIIYYQLSKYKKFCFAMFISNLDQQKIQSYINYLFDFWRQTWGTILYYSITSYTVGVGPFQGFNFLTGHAINTL